MNQSPLQTEIRASLKLAGPIIAAQVAQLGMVFVDNVMVGRLGTKELAAMAMATPYFTVLFVSAIGFLWALSPLISHATGANDEAKIAAVWKHGTRIAFLMAAVIVILFQLSDHVLLLLGQDPALVPTAAAFLKTICWGIPGQLAFICTRQMTEGMSDSKASMLIGLCAFCLNAFLDYVLIYGNFGFPKLGVVGSGLATAMVGWFMFFAMTLYVHTQKRYKAILELKKNVQSDTALYKEIARLGFPIAGAWLGEIGFFSAATVMMGWLGTVQLAAHQIALNAASFAFMFPMGISMSTSIRVGTAVGKKDIPAAKLSGYVGLLLATAITSVTAFIFLTKPEWVVGIYTKDVDVIRIGTALLMLGGVFQLFDGLQVAGAGALRGLKETRIPLINALVAYWVIGMPVSAYLAFRSPLGAAGLWWGMVLSLFIAAALHFARFRYRIRRM